MLGIFFYFAPILLMRAMIASQITERILLPMANLTNKELAAIKDQITTEQALICKSNVYAQTISDQHLSQKCKEIAQKHQQHYNKLMAQLN